MSGNAWKIPGKFPGIFREFLEFPGIPGKFQGISGKISGNFREISGNFRESFREFQGISGNPEPFPEPQVPGIRPIATSEVTGAPGLPGAAGAAGVPD